MGKRKTKRLSNEHNKIETQYDSNISIKKIIIIIVTILLIFGVFYLLTMGILNKKSKTSTVSNTSIQYSEILAGESFTQKDKEYLVFFYDSSKADIDTNHNLISNYKDKDNSLKIYTVDMHEGLNKNYRSETEDNTSASEASQLKISKTTVIHFKDGKVVDYINENIEQYLNNL